jgi:hypothetical protein
MQDPKPGIKKHRIPDPIRKTPDLGKNKNSQQNKLKLTLTCIGS